MGKMLLGMLGRGSRAAQTCSRNRRGLASISSRLCDVHRKRSYSYESGHSSLCQSQRRPGAKASGSFRHGA
jgi:hypothetical protein